MAYTGPNPNAGLGGLGGYGGNPSQGSQGIGGLVAPLPFGATPQASALPNAPTTPPSANYVGYGASPQTAAPAPQYQYGTTPWNAGTYSGGGASPYAGGYPQAPGMLPSGQPAGSISNTGVSYGGQNWTWDQFNAVPPDQQKAMLKNMGMNDQQVTDLLVALQKTEISQFSQYQQQKAFQTHHLDDPTHTGNRIANDIWGWATMHWVPGIHQAEDALTKQMPQAPDIKSVADLQKESGLTDAITNFGSEQKQNVANAAIQQQQQAAGALGSPYTQANLNAYTNTFLLPFLNHVNSMVQGDMSQWGGAIKNLQGLGLPGSVAKDLTPTAGESALYQTLAPLMAQQQWTAPYVNTMNAMMGNQQTLGAKLAAQGANIQTLESLGVIQPGAMGFGGTAGITGLTGTGNSLIPSVSGIVNTFNQPAQQTGP